MTLGLLSVAFVLLAWLMGESIMGEPYRILLTLILLGYVITLMFRRFYGDIRELRGRYILRNTVETLSFLLLLTFTGLFVLHISNAISRLFFVTYFAVLLVLMPLSHIVLRKLLTWTLGFRERSMEKAVILGANLVGRKLNAKLTRNTYYGIRVLGFFDDTPLTDYKLLGSIAEAKDYIKANGVTRIYCSLPMIEEALIRDFQDFAEANVISFYFVPQISYCLYNQMEVEVVQGIPVFAMRRSPLDSFHNVLIKRALDVVLSVFFLLVIFPLVCLIFVPLIKLSSPGPVFFRQQRTGRNGKTFYCYKFRSMRPNRDADRLQATANDSRKTRVGDFMRRTNIDELPQFINVLRGEMSIVGPRPHMLLHTESYSQLIGKYMVRHFIKPGVTGWAQIHGFRGETKELAQMEGRIIKDIWYIEHWSIWLDLEIIFRTAFSMVAGDKKAY
jgi:putative colanic acid biosynthesis UDP-glucose lipid carrier transferase